MVSRRSPLPGGAHHDRPANDQHHPPAVAPIRPGALMNRVGLGDDRMGVHCPPEVVRVEYCRVVRQLVPSVGQAICVLQRVVHEGHAQHLVRLVEAVERRDRDQVLQCVEVSERGRSEASVSVGDNEGAGTRHEPRCPAGARSICEGLHERGRYRSQITGWTSPITARTRSKRSDQDMSKSVEGSRFNSSSFPRKLGSF